LSFLLINFPPEFSGASIDPELLLAVFLPALLFESAFSMEIHQIKVRFVSSIWVNVI
jgi:NhaP-type Na+/H+ or K+/H+ antiporter